MTVTAFLWVVAICHAIDVIGRVIHVSRGNFAPQRKPADFLIDMVLNAMILVWAVLLLVGPA